MALFKIFSGKDPAELEKKGDGFLAAKAWGRAKIEYDKALDKLEKSSSPSARMSGLREKIRQTQESLALEHIQTAENFIEQEYDEDARQYYRLALELTQDRALKNVIETRLAELKHLAGKAIRVDLQPMDADQEEAPIAEDDENYFAALCGGLPEDIQEAYLNYGEEFKAGYLALNRGDFELSAGYLLRAMEKSQSSVSYISLELATAYYNLGKYAEAQNLLEAFLVQHPDALPGYQLLCEIYWEMRAFDRAEALLDSVPGEVAESLGVYLLRGETLFHSGKYAEAQAYYTEILDRYGWREPIAKALAQAFEAGGELENARNILSEIMGKCRGCGTQIDPWVKQKYAELSYAAGRHTTDILELFLALAQQIPEKAPEYYQCVSRIYETQANSEQARRFQLVSEKLKSDANRFDEKRTRTVD